MEATNNENKEQEEQVGVIKHYFNKIGVAVLELSGTLKTGDTIHIKSAETDFVQEVDSMQVEHASVEEAGAGMSVGLKVSQPVKEKDSVYKK